MFNYWERNHHSRQEEEKLSLFSDYMSLYVENPKYSTKKPIRLNEFSKVAGYKGNTQKSVAFLWTMNNLKGKYKNNIYKASKNNKILTNFNQKDETFILWKLQNIAGRN